MFSCSSFRKTKSDKNMNSETVSIKVTEISKDICDLNDVESLESSVKKICNALSEEIEYISSNFPKIENKEIIRLHIRALMNTRAELSMHAEILTHGLNVADTEKALSVKEDYEEELTDTLTIEI